MCYYYYYLKGEKKKALLLLELFFIALIINSLWVFFGAHLKGRRILSEWMSRSMRRDLSPERWKRISLRNEQETHTQAGTYNKGQRFFLMRFQAKWQTQKLRRKKYSDPPSVTPSPLEWRPINACIDSWQYHRLRRIIVGCNVMSQACLLQFIVAQELTSVMRCDVGQMASVILKCKRNCRHVNGLSCRVKLIRASAKKKKDFKCSVLLENITDQGNSLSVIDYQICWCVHK